MEDDAKPVNQSITANNSTIQNVQQVFVSRSKENVPVPFRVPPLPPYFVSRPDIEDQLLKSIFNSKSPNGVLVTGAIHGIGGLGKSILVSSLAHKKEVQELFPDGILWATLGQEPNLAVLLSDWIRELGDYEFKVEDEQSASGHLQTLMRGKALLIVVDDVWNAQHLKKFLVAGSPSQILITTRNADIANLVNAEVFNLSVMTTEQSLQLITNMLPRQLEKEEHCKAVALAKELGFLPLALNLATAQIIDGLCWDELLRDLRLEVARLERIKISGRLVEYGISSEQLKDYSLLASFNLSLQRLDKVSQKYFAWLGIIAEDAPFDEIICSTLWGVSVSEASETLRYFRSKALIYDAGGIKGEIRRYRIHDLLHDTARIVLTFSDANAQLIDIPKLGIDLKSAHTIFIQKYYKQSKYNSQWHCIADDGYLETYLTHHIVNCSNPGIMHELLRETNIDNKNGWYSRKESIGKTASFIRDVQDAYELISSSRPNIEAEWRYRLIFSTLNSLAQNLPLTLLQELINSSLWSIAQSLTYVRRLSDENIKPKAYQLVLSSDQLQDDEKKLVVEEAVKSAIAVKNYKLLLNILFHCDLEKRLKYCKSYWYYFLGRNSNLKKFGEKGILDDEIFNVISTLDNLESLEFLLPDMLEYCTKISKFSVKEHSVRAQYLEQINLIRAIAKFIPVEKYGLVYCFIETALQDEDSWSKGWSGEYPKARLWAAQIAKHFGYDYSFFSKINVNVIHDFTERAVILLGFGQLACEEKSKEKYYDSAARSLMLVKQKKDCIDAVCFLAPRFDQWRAKKLWMHALEVAESLGRNNERSEYLFKLFAAADDEIEFKRMVLRAVKDAVYTIKNKEDLYIAQANLMNAIGDLDFIGNHSDILLNVQKIKSNSIRSQKLALLSKLYEPGRRKELLLEAVSSVQEINDYGGQVVALASSISAIKCNSVEGLVNILINKLASAMQSDSVNAVKALEKLIFSVELKAEKIKNLSKIVKKIPDHFLRVKAISLIIEVTHSNTRDTLIKSAFNSVKRVGKNPELSRYADEKTIFKALEFLVPYLSGEMLNEVFYAVDEIDFKHSYSHCSKSLGNANWIRTLAPVLQSNIKLWDVAVERAIVLKDYVHYTQDDTFYIHYKEYALFKLIEFSPKSRMEKAYQLALDCRAKSEGQVHPTEYIFMLVQLMKKNEMSKRLALMKKICELDLKFYNGKSIDFDSAIELFRMLSEENDQEVFEGAAINLFLLVKSGTKKEVLNFLMNEHYEIYSLIVEADQCTRSESKSFQLNKSRSAGDSVEAQESLECFVYKNRYELLNAVPSILAKMNEDELEDQALAIAETIVENTVWWP